MTEPNIGRIYALLAFFAWGVLPLYWKMLISIPPQEILLHRIFWSFIFMFLLLYYRKRFQEFKRHLRHPKVLTISIICGLLMTGNWGLYIWAVNNGYVLETSLGYFISPLIYIFMGMVFLKEKLRKLQQIAVGIAFFAVSLVTLQFQSFPWIALTLALSFTTYGLLRKKAPVDSLMGLTLETLFITPLTLIAFGYLITTNQSLTLTAPFDIQLLLIGAGLATGLPLLWFSHGAKRLPLNTIGLFQYIAPSFQFLSAILIFKEDFSQDHKMSFGFIWLALIIYTIDMIQSEVKKRKARH